MAFLFKFCIVLAFDGRIVDLVLSVFRLSLCLFCTVSSYLWVLQLLKECRYLNMLLYLLCTCSIPVLFVKHICFSTSTVEFWYLYAEKVIIANVVFFPVCGPSRSHLHAQEVPARSHVSTSRANQACPPLHPLPNHLSGYTVGGEDDQVHLHSLPCHGNVFTRYTSI